jgi:hypothetical protein
VSKARRLRKHAKKVEYVSGLIRQMLRPEPGTPTGSPPNVWAMGEQIRKVTGGNQ